MYGWQLALLFLLAMLTISNIGGFINQTDKAIKAKWKDPAFDKWGICLCHLIFRAATLYLCWKAGAFSLVL